VSAPGARPAAAGSERLARAVVTGCAVLVVAACFGFSFGNVLALGRYLGVPEWVAWLVAPAVDLTVVGLIVGVRYLSLRGVEGRRLRPARLMLIAAGLATWALNTAHALLVRHHLGVVAYDSLAPLLLIGWAEVGPWFLRQFRAAAPDKRAEALVTWLREQVAHVLRIAPGRVDLSAPLKTMGLDSLLSLEFRNRLEAALGLSLPATLAWNYPTVSALALHLEERLERNPPDLVDESSAVPPGDPGDLERILDEIEELSEDEVRRLLTSRGAAETIR